MLAEDFDDALRRHYLEFIQCRALYLAAYTFRQFLQKHNFVRHLQIRRLPLPRVLDAFQDALSFLLEFAQSRPEFDHQFSSGQGIPQWPGGDGAGAGRGAESGASTGREYDVARAPIVCSSILICSPLNTSNLLDIA
jgi:hypothetical protein